MTRNTLSIAVVVAALLLALAPAAFTDGDTPSRAAVRRIEIPDNHVLDVFTIGGRDGRLECVHFEEASGQLRYEVSYDSDAQLLEVTSREGSRVYRYTFFRPVRWDVYKL